MSDIPWTIKLMTASLSSKMYNWDSLWEECAFGRTWFNCDQCWTSRCPFGLVFLGELREQSLVSHLLPDAGLVGVFLCCSVNAQLLSPYPINREQVIRPFTIQQPMKQFSILWNWETELLAHPTTTNRNKCTTSNYTKVSSWCWLLSLKVTSEVKVLKWSQSTLLRFFVAHDNLACVSCVMNVLC